MKINKLIIENLGLYCGKRVFDFSSATTEKPIILFGGLNGAGKTTLFDGIRLCLYGKEIFKRISNAKYSQYLADKIHRSDNLAAQPNYASIGIEFEYAEDGVMNTYYVERSWSRIVENLEGNVDHTNKTNFVTEKLIVYRNNETLSDVIEEGWQEFVKELIPIGVSQLFFFDGEKIQNIISNKDNPEFRRSVKSLLGLDIIDRLQADIKIYRNRKLKEHSSEKDRLRLENIDQDIQALSNKIKEIEDDKATFQNKLERAQDAQKKSRDKFEAEGGIYHNRKHQLIQDKSLADEKLQELESSMAEIAAGSLPLVIAAKLANRMRTQLLSEQDIYAQSITETKIAEQRKILDQLVETTEEFQAIDPTVRRNLLQKLEKLFVLPKRKKCEELFGYSPSQVSNVVNSIDSNSRTAEQLKRLASRHEVYFNQIRQLISDINSAPDEELAEIMFKNLMKHNDEVSRLQEHQSIQNQRIVDLQNEVAILEKESDLVLKKIAEAEKNDRKLELTYKTDRVLEKYKVALTQNRIGKLKSEFLSTFNELHRKDDLVANVEVDPVTIEFSLFDKSGTRLEIDKLSSGEKEIYAISLLSALARTSGMNLPFIIDTPLGRLDTVHRESLVKKFFPYISHQMLLFSTDTEIGEEYYKDLEPHVCETFQLGYNDTEKSTHVDKGYFWK